MKIILAKIKRLAQVLLLFISIVSLVTSCAMNPATGTPDFVFMSESEEIRKGKEMHEKMLKSMPIYQDEKLTAYINEVGQKVAKNSHRPGIKYHFTIVDLPDINAFALPGGYIYINRGLLAYLDSEAQLAAVLAHEVGHVTARHVVRQDSARKGVSTLSILSVFTTGSMALADAANLMGTAAVKGYGREMELEADGFGAEYLFNSGYDPHAMVETIGVLKDQEKFARYRAKSEGKKAKSYHGVFSTHPRNDIRLKEVISKAGEFPDNVINDAKKLASQKNYREHIEGMVYGINYDARPKPKPLEKGRYLHKKLGFSLLFPPEWQVENTRQAIIGQPDDKSAEIKLMIARNVKGLSPEDFLRGAMKIKMLQRAENFSQNGLIGHTGMVIDENGDFSQRVAVLFQGSRVYLLKGIVNNAKSDIDYDKMFLKSIHSFRPERSIIKRRKSNTIHYVKANDKTRIDELAKHMKLGTYSAQQLRLINGLYPRGEPKTGDWIKIIQ